MDIKAPYNIQKSGPTLFLKDFYKITLAKMGRPASQLEPFLFYTFCGDLLGSSGEHYEKGAPISFGDAVLGASHTISDDFMESLAMSLMVKNSYSLDLKDLLRARDDFYAHLKQHFEQCSMTYSPWFRPLFDAQTEDAFFQVIASHASCGAAMRSGILGAMNIDKEVMLPLLFLSHAHAGAIEGAFLISGIVRGLIHEGIEDFNSALQYGYQEARWGRQQAVEFLGQYGAVQSPEPEYEALIGRVITEENPYAIIKDIKQEGIETYFVVPAAIYILWEIYSGADIEKNESFCHVVQRSLEIGGDPDTICSIAMGLLGAFSGDQFREKLCNVELPQKMR